MPLNKQTKPNQSMYYQCQVLLLSILRRVQSILQGIYSFDDIFAPEFGFKEFSFFLRYSIRNFSFTVGAVLHLCRDSICLLDGVLF